MSSIKNAGTSEERRITVDDLKQKAMHVRDVAQVEARSIARTDTTKMIIAGLATFAAAVSIAYYLGARHARQA